jgi:hypothetical protein
VGTSDRPGHPRVEAGDPVRAAEAPGEEDDVKTRAVPHRGLRLIERWFALRPALPERLTYDQVYELAVLIEREIRPVRRAPKRPATGGPRG